MKPFSLICFGLCLLLILVTVRIALASESQRPACQSGTCPIGDASQVVQQTSSDSAQAFVLRDHLHVKAATGHRTGSLGGNFGTREAADTTYHPIRPVKARRAPKPKNPSWTCPISLNALLSWRGDE